MDIDSPVTTAFMDRFSSLAAKPAQERVQACPKLLDDILSNLNAGAAEADLTAYLVFILDSERSIQGVSKPAEPLSLIASRPLLSSFIERLTKEAPNQLKLDICRTAINFIQPRVVSFEEQDTALKFLLTDAQEADEDFGASARTLDSINLTTSSRTVTDAEKANIWVRIARCYLEEDDPIQATAFVNRAKQIIHNVNDPGLRLQFHTSSARIADAQRSFLDAANSYHNISYDAMIAEEDRMQTLAAALNCAVLAPAGPARSRVLAKLYKDERTQELESYSILVNIFLDRMLEAEEVTNFAAKLPEHHKARTADGNTVFERAMIEHNVLGASRIYRNISINQLGTLLGIDGDRAEQYTAQMIEQGRLSGHIDQIDRIIFFDGQGSKEKTATGGSSSRSIGAELRRYDLNVQGLAEEVEKVTTMIQTEMPEFYAEQMAH